MWCGINADSGWRAFAASQPEKPPRLLGYVAEIRQAAVFSDQIQQIAMRALGGVLSTSGGALARAAATEPHK
ncbi:MAG: hypothetical protein B7Z58_18460 [Acidiphilium sp. 37-64-53]|nr:MAG: hypothetical protein B7Z58_18460 [Acidiphilium sp. 37-64-53]OZB21320.1 MAG: hypothetical protein B7X49_17860 [Acidiphilium sp. 34-64-41]